MRLTPDLLAWVKKRGGATYIRSLVVADLEQAERTTKLCSHCGEQIQVGADQVEVQIKSKETTYFHLDCALPLLGKAKSR